ncbi:zinc-binding dehydrogenase [Embleya hyalina]|uniref:NADPH:quinone reductase n=1 Tax=Embleya hyalina TaxID=516124 RepID=A0A401YF19_9ACTN|nr:zinc-binding dehydrogenase [Embleya hyalina]GCD93193.1 NADPH:quinone reductase [Embleya hyalina]
MRAAWYERNGPARDVLTVGELPTPSPAPGEVRVRVAVSAVHRCDTRKRRGTSGSVMRFPRIIPHDDGAGVIDAVGRGVDARRLGQRVWVYLAQSYRPFGTAAEYTVVPDPQAVALPAGVPFDQVAGLGRPGITGHRAILGDGTVVGQTVVVTGALGSVGRSSLAVGRRAGATVIAAVRQDAQVARALAAGAHHAVDLASGRVARRILELAPGGVHRVADCAFADNLATWLETLAYGGTIATYANGRSRAPVPFRSLAVKNVTVHFLGNDDFPDDANHAAAVDLTAALCAGDLCFPKVRSFALDDIVEAHEAAEQPATRGRVVVTP